MGYLDTQDGAEPVPVFMYDGAAGRADVGPKVSFVTPSERFKDGPQLQVLGSLCFCSSGVKLCCRTHQSRPHMRFSQRDRWWNVSFARLTCGGC